MDADLVVMPMRRPGTPRMASSTARVTRKRVSAGWYGSVAAPMATSCPLSRARAKSADNRLVSLLDLGGPKVFVSGPGIAVGGSLGPRTGVLSPAIPRR